MRFYRRSLVWSAATALVLVAAPGRAQERKLTLERLQAEPPLAGSLPTGLLWHPDGKRLTYLRHRGAEAAADLVATDAASGREALLLAGESVKNPTTGKPLPLDDYQWSPEGDFLLVSALGDVFVVQAKTGSARALTRTPEAEEFPQLSPDGRRVAFVRKNDLYVVDVPSGRETRLTKSGSDTLLNGRLDWVYQEELASRSGRAFWWSPTSDAVAFLQLDQARVPTFPIVDFLPVHNEVKLQRYPKPGDPNAIVRVGVVGLAKDGAPGPERLVSFDPDDVYVVPELAFTPDGRGLAFPWLNRAQSELQVRLLAVPASPAAPLGAARRAFPAPAHPPLVRANGTDIAYTETGDGPPLILLHGALASTGPAVLGSRRRTAPTACWSRPTGATTPTRALRSRPRLPSSSRAPMACAR